jgi:agmatinase
MKTFAGIDQELADYKNASVLLQSIPYDGTSTWGKGADKGFDAFLDAAENMEIYDIETDQEVYKRGIHILPEIGEKSSPEAVFKSVRERCLELLKTDKFLTFFGGEHSVSIGIIDAFKEKYKNLTVLQIDAHADLRASYLGSQYNHACAMHLASKTTNLVQVGIRSMDVSEKQFLNPEHCFFAHDIAGTTDWFDAAINLMTDEVYLSIDLDAFDPSIMPATGTPEPGGIDWYQSLKFLRRVFTEKKVVGFDIVEFAPIENLKAPGFLIAKLYYKLLSYKYENE